jgi:hypothetical protein
LNVDWSFEDLNELSEKVNNIDFEKINDSLKEVDLIGFDWDYIETQRD